MIVLFWCAIAQTDYIDANFAAAVVSLNMGTISKIAVSSSCLDKYTYGKKNKKAKVTF